jgi:ABC-type glycerol-3-phosphate transport system permease component
MLMATTVLTALPVLKGYQTVRHHLVGGLTAGGVKG